jgi:type II secretory pathway component PulF
MAEDDRLFDYVAIDPSGRRIKGSISARTNDNAFDRLKRDGLAPIRIRSTPHRTTSAGRQRGLSDREASEFLSDLSALLGAGIDMRTALGILSARGDRQTVRALARTLAMQIGGGAALDESFAGQLGKNGPFVAALISSGDLVGGLQRASDMLQSRVRLQDQLITVLSYPAFVLLSTLAALAVIILFVVPSLAPLVADVGGHAPLVLGVLIAISNFLRGHALALAVMGLMAVTALLAAAQQGVLGQLADKALLDGPSSRTVSGLVFGAFAVALGNMLIAGAPMSEALRLATRSVRSRAARARLEPVAQAVRQGQTLSAALDRVKPFPETIIRLVAVGEVSGSLGLMLARAGKLEEDASIKRIESAGRWLGPALIVGLGAIIGLMMGGLLTGVSQLGQSALQ